MPVNGIQDFSRTFIWIKNIKMKEKLIWAPLKTVIQDGLKRSMLPQGNNIKFSFVRFCSFHQTQELCSLLLHYNDA